MRKILLSVIACAVCICSSAQSASQLKYVDIRELGLPLLGQGFDDCLREGSAEEDAAVRGAATHDEKMKLPGAAEEKGSVGKDPLPVCDGYYTRLPAGLKGKVRKAVWDLGQSSAGISLRFSSNSRTIGLKWTTLKNYRMSHMAPSGICGFDLYAYDGKEWRFAGTARPKDRTSKYVMVRNMDGQMREYLLFFPLYDGVIKAEIGIESDAVLQAPRQEEGKNLLFGKELRPIVFYGTSITQGGCASRPGMAGTNILERKLKREVINLGFSGNGRMDRIMADEVAKIDAGAFVIDCIGNCNVQILRDSSWHFIRKVASSHPDVPVYMTSNYPYQNIWLDNKLRQEVIEEDAIWYSIYSSLRDEGLKNLRFIRLGKGYDSPAPLRNAATGPDEDASVDGCHLTDLGFTRWAECLYRYLSNVR